MEPSRPGAAYACRVVISTLAAPAARGGAASGLEQKMARTRDAALESR